MTKRADKPRDSVDSPQPGAEANVLCIPDAILELRKDVRELREKFDDLPRAAFRICAYFLGALVGGYLLLSSKFDRIDDELSAQSKRVDQRFDAVDQRFDAVHQKFDAVHQKFDAINQKLADISLVVARIDERTSAAPRAEKASQAESMAEAQSAATGTRAPESATRPGAAGI